MALGLLTGSMLVVPAQAQIAGAVSINSDYRLRGYSLTDDHPALSGQVTYDDPSGFYASVSGLSEFGSRTRFLGIMGNVGYAKRFNQRITLDAGVLRSQIRGAAPETLGFKYTEFYAGAYIGPVSGRVYYSPDYRTGHRSTLYSELETGFEPLPKWRVSGHLGWLTYLKSSAYYRAGEAHGDWGITVSRQLGRLELHALLSRGESITYDGVRLHRKPALSAGASLKL